LFAELTTTSHALSVAFMDVDKDTVICICLSDFKGLRNTATYKVGSIAQTITLQRLAANTS
jgi:hypothetical protein